MDADMLFKQLLAIQEHVMERQGFLEHLQKGAPEDVSALLGFARIAYADVALKLTECDALRAYGQDFEEALEGR